MSVKRYWVWMHELDEAPNGKEEEPHACTTVIHASDYDALQSQVDALRAVIAEVHEAAASGLLDTSFLACMPPKNTVAYTILQILKQHAPATGEQHG